MGCCNHPPPPGQGPPSVAQQAASFGRALVNFALGGFRQVSPADLKARLDVCDGCPYQRPKGACSACGCILDIKARMPAEYCPKEKWPPLTS
jgi:hypothetical protein